MRDRVVAMQEIEPVVEHHLVHAHGEREIVRRILEQRVPADVDLVEVDAWQKRRQAERLLVRDEVNLVSAPRQRDAELRGQRAGTAVRWIAGDADLHVVASRPTPPSAHCAAASRQLLAVGSRCVTRSAGS